MKKVFLFVLVSIFPWQLPILAQNAPARNAKKDSVYFSKPYPFILPIMGSKVHNLGFKLPFPMGVMINALAVKQDLTLTNLKVGFNESDWIELDDVVTFDKISSQAATFNARFDLWVLPFLNVYGIFGRTADADIDVNLVEPFPLNITTSIGGNYVGYGLLLAGGVGPLFVSIDANRTYNYNPRLDDPAKVFIAGMRTGPIIRFKNNADMNVVIWAGAMYSHFNGETIGSINVLDIAPDAPGKIDEMQGDLDSWYDGLSAAQKILYNGIYTRLSDGFTNLKGNIETGYIRYDMTKEITQPWNMLIGAQWQINYRWQIRTEAQFLGSRTAAMLSLNYRFGVKGKNWLSGVSSK
jgi:hypothetical protein